jgi:ribonuclease P protein component
MTSTGCPVPGIKCQALMPNNMSLLNFRKNERLAKKKSIERLFHEGASFFIHPFKVYWLITPIEQDVPAQLLVIVGKRSFKRAVDRNRIRRQIREMYRLNKPGFYRFLGEQHQQCLLTLIYTSNQHIETQELERKIKFIFRRLENDIEAKVNNITRTLSDY